MKSGILVPKEVQTICEVIVIKKKKLNEEQKLKVKKAFMCAVSDKLLKDGTVDITLYNKLNEKIAKIKS